MKQIAFDTLTDFRRYQKDVMIRSRREARRIRNRKPSFGLPLLGAVAVILTLCVESLSVLLPVAVALTAYGLLCVWLDKSDALVISLVVFALVPPVQVLFEGMTPDNEIFLFEYLPLAAALAVAAAVYIVFHRRALLTPSPTAFRRPEGVRFVDMTLADVKQIASAPVYTVIHASPKEAVTLRRMIGVRASLVNYLKGKNAILAASELYDKTSPETLTFYLYAPENTEEALRSYIEKHFHNASMTSEADPAWSRLRSDVLPDDKEVYRLFNSRLSASAGTKKEESRPFSYTLLMPDEASALAMTDKVRERGYYVRQSNIPSEDGAGRLVVIELMSPLSEERLNATSDALIDLAAECGGKLHHYNLLKKK